MFGSIIHRMIFRELLRVFLLSLFSLTGILLMAGIVAEATQQGLGPGQILKIIPLLIPSTLPYTIPATTLFATCVVYGRLAADNEILAIRAGGINMTRVVWPGVVLGLMTSVATLGLYYHVIPYTHHVMRSMFLADVEELLYTMLRKNGQITYPHLNYSMYVKGVRDRRLIDPMFTRRDSRKETDIVAQAREAELRVDTQQKLILVHMRYGYVLGRDGAQAEFDDRIFDVPLPDEINPGSYRRARDMTWEELYESLAELEARDVEVLRQIEQAEAEARDPDGGKVEQHVLENWRTERRLIRMQINGILAEKEMRPALSLGCLFFVIVGCPVGIWFSRSDYLSAFISCFLPIVLVYYPLVLCSTSMVKEGKFPPFLTIWSADFVMGAIGVFLFSRLLRN